MSEQMDLFDSTLFPDREDLVDMVRARSFFSEQQDDRPKLENGGVTGKNVLARLSRDEELCTEICTALVLGMSGKLVARKFRISPRSVRRIKSAMEDRGELAPIRLRIQRKLNEFIEAGLDEMTEAVYNGKIAPGQIPIPVLAAIDKREQLSAGIVAGTDKTHTQISAEDVKAQWETLKRMTDSKRTSVDSQSIGLDHKSLSNNASDVLETVLDTISHHSQSDSDLVAEESMVTSDSGKGGEGVAVQTGGASKASHIATDNKS